MANFEQCELNADDLISGSNSDLDSDCSEGIIPDTSLGSLQLKRKHLLVSIYTNTNCVNVLDDSSSDDDDHDYDDDYDRDSEKHFQEIFSTENDHILQPPSPSWNYQDLNMSLLLIHLPYLILIYFSLSHCSV
mgnify:CR=1 FL=1